MCNFHYSWYLRVYCIRIYSTKIIVQFTISRYQNSYSNDADIYIYIYIYIEKLHNIFRRSSKGSTNTSRYFEFLLLILFNISSCACVISSALLIQRIAVVNFDIILCLGNIMKSTIGVSHLNKVILSRKAYWSVYDEISL